MKPQINNFRDFVLTFAPPDRYWGESSPFDELTVENLQYLTLAQSIADTTYFAKNVVFPFDTNGSSQATRAVRLRIHCLPESLP